MLTENDKKRLIQYSLFFASHRHCEATFCTRSTSRTQPRYWILEISVHCREDVYRSTDHVDVNVNAKIGRSPGVMTSVQKSTPKTPGRASKLSVSPSTTALAHFRCWQRASNHRHGPTKAMCVCHVAHNGRRASVVARADIAAPRWRLVAPQMRTSLL